MKFTSIFFKANESILFKDTNKRAKIVQANWRSPSHFSKKREPVELAKPIPPFPRICKKARVRYSCFLAISLVNPVGFKPTTFRTGI